MADVLVRRARRTGSERERARTDQSFTVRKADIAAQGYNRSLNLHQGVVHDEVEHRPPVEIIADIEALEAETRELKACTSAANGKQCNRART